MLEKVELSTTLRKIVAILKFEFIAEVCVGGGGGRICNRVQLILFIIQFNCDLLDLCYNPIKFNVFFGVIYLYIM